MNLVDRSVVATVRANAFSIVRPPHRNEAILGTGKQEVAFPVVVNVGDGPLMALEQDWFLQSHTPTTSMGNRSSALQRQPFTKETETTMKILASCIHSAILRTGSRCTGMVSNDRNFVRPSGATQYHSQDEGT